jgi:hypothetical protein
LGFHKRVEGDGLDGRYRGFPAFHVSGSVRELGRQVPAYSSRGNRDDLEWLLTRLEKQSSPTNDESGAGFAH